MSLYWLAPLLCGVMGFVVTFPIKNYLNKLLQGKKLEKLLLSEKVTQAVSDGIGHKLVELTQDTRTIAEVIDSTLGKETRLAAIENSSTALAGFITQELKNSQISDIILEEIKRVLVEKVKLGFLTGLMKDNIWDLVREPMEKAIESYLKERCQPLIKTKLQERFTTLSEKRMYDVGELLLPYREQISEEVIKIYKTHAISVAEKLLNKTGDIKKLFHKELLKMQIGITAFGVFCGLVSLLLALL